MYNKFKVAIDVDNILNDLVEKTIKLYNSTYHASLSMKDIVEYDFYKCLPYNDALNLVKLFDQKELWESLTPRKDAQWGVKKLIDNGYDVCLATAAYPTNYAWKCEWLSQHFPFIPTKNIICIHNKGLLDVDVLIEDCMDNLLSGHLFERVCLDYLWNQNVHDEAYGIHRAYSWKDIVSIVDKIYNSKGDLN